MKLGTDKKTQFLVILLGLTVSISYFFYDYRRIQAQSYKDFSAAFQKRYRILQGKFDSERIIINSIGKFFEASTRIDKNEFHIFTSNIMEQHQIQNICWFSAKGELLSASQNHDQCRQINLLKSTQILPSKKPTFVISSFVRSSAGQNGIVSILTNLLEVDLLAQANIEDEYILLFNQSSNQLIGYNLKDQKLIKNIDPLQNENTSFIKKGIKNIDGLKLYYLAHQRESTSSSVALRILLIISFLIFSIFLSISFYIKTLLSQQRLIKKEVEKKTQDLTREIEQRKRAQYEAEKYANIKSEFMANMSHEIRTPMNGVLGMMELLSKTPLTDQQQDYLNTATRSGEGLMSLLNDILDFSKIESGKLELSKTTFNLHQAFLEVSHLFQSNIEKKNISLKIDLEAPEVIVSTDKRRLQQIIINLLSNAIKFTTEGSIWISLKVSLNDSMETAQISFSIRDSGIGISEYDIQKLFKSFSQVDASVSRNYGGTGLGLSISYHLLQMMEGTIEVDSKLGIGSKFSVELSLPFIGHAESTQSPQTSSDSRVLKNTDKLSEDHPLNILVAEDNEINQKLIKAFFKKLGYQITIAEDGQVACALAKENKYDFIFMDLQMPNMGGLEATKSILAQNPPHPTIVAMTANVFAEDRAASMEAGMVDFLAKPVRLASIREVILKNYPKE